MKTRQLQVYLTYRPEGQYSTGFRKLPEIRMRGVWLEQAGFRPYDRLEVQVESGKLVLIKAKEE